MSDDWQKKLRFRGFRLAGWTLPLVMLSLFSASLIPRRPPLILADADAINRQKVSGRMIFPYGLDEIPLTLELIWHGQPPRMTKVELQVADPSGNDRIQKKWIAKPVRRGKVWQQNIEVRLGPREIQNYSLLVQSEQDVSTHYRLIAFATSPAARYFRFGEMLLYPSLALFILAVAMILFPSFIRS